MLTILIIRHAEKPEEFWPGPGLTPEGVPDKRSLVIRGWQRAGSWAALFAGGLGGAEFPRPDAIYAADPENAKGAEPSRRPDQTVIPVAARLNITPVTTYGVGDEAALAGEIAALSGVVLVAWEHKAIGEALLPALAGGQNIPNLPRKWDGTRFDIVLRFDRDEPGAPWTFRQLFPRLLSGDSNVPMP